MTVVALAALVLAAPASGKELTRVAVCGVGDACTVITDPDRLADVPMGGSTSVDPPPPEPFYTVTLTIAHGQQVEPGLVYFLPRSNLIVANGRDPGQLVWLPITEPESTKLMRDAARELEPHAAPKAWPGELKSTYRVIPDDAIRVPGTPAAGTREPSNASNGGISWLSTLVVAALAGLAVFAYGRRKPRGTVGVRR